MLQLQNFRVLPTYLFLFLLNISVCFERSKNVTNTLRNTNSFLQYVGMNLPSHVFITLDSKNSLWYTSFQHNIHMPEGIAMGL